MEGITASISVVFHIRYAMEAHPEYPVAYNCRFQRRVIPYTPLLYASGLAY